MKETTTIIDESSFISAEDQTSWIQDRNKVNVALKNGKVNTLIFETEEQAREYVDANTRLRDAE